MLNETLHADSAHEFAPALSAGLAHPEGALVDKFGRRVSYIRLSITDRCDFRCTYCMSEEMTFLPRSEVLSLEECVRIVSAFVSLGVNKVRITGGEPLVRRDALWLLEQLGTMPGLEQLVLTTNGSQLERFANPLKAAGVARLNVSLDTLDAQRFKSITRIGDLDKVLRGIDAARKAGFEHTKINTVMMRGRNDDEFVRLVEFAIREELDISFIEEMPLGDILGRESSYISSAEAQERLTEHLTLVPSTESSGGPARYWRIPGSRARVGFISPHSHNFCDTCNRVRITAKGELYPCLGQNDSLALLPLLRDASSPAGAIRQAIIDSMGIKPWGHDFSAQMLTPQVVRFMSMTGG